MAERGMGRGLAAILQVSGQHGDRPELRDISIELVEPNPSQPRRRFDEEALDALAASLAENGVLQPILVRPREGGRYELVAGERRWRAAQRAGLAVLPAIVERRDDASSLEAAIVENMAREDLNPVEEARAVAALVEELGLTREEVGRRVGRSRVAVSNLLRLLDLPADVLTLLESGRITEGHGRAVLLAEDENARRRLARAAADGGWSVRVTEDRARKANEVRVTRGPGRAEPHPDQVAACEEIAETLALALGREVKVRPRGTAYKVELAVDGPDDAQALALRLRGVPIT
ncbi:MAG TPA: ParB/RepB/Spo0J family partition protein [Solirubrobacteraceae bacterium]|nr:ParB/RepB/Spo0J family partition protein [Solirubrobacteraceae bacterium]